MTSSRVSTFLLIAVLAVCTGCFPMGLPERFADLNAISPAQKTLTSFSRSTRTKLKLQSPRVLLLTSGQAQAIPSVEKESPISLGNQYLFGIFPVTWLYLQHSPEAMLLETSLSLLRENGADVFVADVKNSELAEAYVQPNFTVLAEPSDLSVNAYDAFFFRILRVEGELKFQIRTATDVKLPDKVVHEISESKYSSSGHAPALAMLLESAMRKTIQKEYLPLLNFRPSSNAVRRRSVAPLIIIEPPTFIQEVDPELGLLFAQSYGFTSTGKFVDGQLLRLLQRGIAQAATDSGLASLTSSTSNAILSGSPWVLRASVSEIAASNESDSAISLDVEFELSSGNPARHGPPFKATCHVKHELESFDGAPVVALEQAAATATVAFLNSDSTICK